MKRLFALLLSLLLLWAMVPMVSADSIYNDDQLDWGGMYDPTTPCSHRTRIRHEAVASTCVAAGHGAYVVCGDCGILLEGSDAALPLADHAYDNACDTDCNGCGATREASDHVYDDGFDPDCNTCGAVRDVAVKGDANGDGLANNHDLGFLQQYINEREVTIDLYAVDLDGNGRLSNRDLGLLQRYLNGWEI